MPENTWDITDSIPITLAPDFEAPAVEKVWGWFGLPAGEGSAFETSALPWIEHDWLRTFGYGMAADQGGGAPLFRSLIIQQAVNRASNY